MAHPDPLDRGKNPSELANDLYEGIQEFSLAPLSQGPDLDGELPEFQVVEFGEVDAKGLGDPRAKPAPRPSSKTQAAPGKGETSSAEEIVAWVDETEDQISQQRNKSVRRRLVLTAVPSWLISLMVHVALILILATVTLDPQQTIISILEASTAGIATVIEEFDLQAPSLDVSSLALEESVEPSESVNEIVAMPEISSPLIPAFETKIDSLMKNRMTESIMPSSVLASSALSQMSAALNSRSSASKSEMLERFGGNAASEKAVALALKWIAAHQASDGGWNFAHAGICGNQCPDAGDLGLARNGATAMAILPFLGAGQTHIEGQYQQTVKSGLAFLINRMQVTPSLSMPYGSWHEPGGTMYSHGLASIAICEAYAMTKDPDLLQPAQLALNFLTYAQSKNDGGWRYGPNQPGDTSVVGWCVMALKSGKMGNLVVPNSTLQSVDQFLNRVSTNQGAYYGYTGPTSKLEGRQATIAVGLLCRMYMGWPREHPGLQTGVKYLSERGPSGTDLYYDYYATQVMRHQGGEVWVRWNGKMRDDLIKMQVTSGHAAGSWYVKGPHSEKGGRLYTTSLATMILEVYYRHMPLYSEKSSNDDFEL